MYTCRECERPINQATEVCPYCGADLIAGILAEGGEGSRTGALRKRIALWGAMIAAMWAFLWFILPERSSNAGAEAEQQAVATLQEARAVLAAYADAQGGYPVTLDAMGEPNVGKIRETAQRAQRLGYRLEYAPSAPDADGSVRNFALLARPGNYSYRNFFIDASGAVRWTRENRPATAQDRNF